VSSADYKEPCTGIIADCISLPLSLLSITLLRNGPSIVKIYGNMEYIYIYIWKVLMEKKIGLGCAEE